MLKGITNSALDTPAELIARIGPIPDIKVVNAQRVTSPADGARVTLIDLNGGVSGVMVALRMACGYEAMLFDANMEIYVDDDDAITIPLYSLFLHYKNISAWNTTGAGYDQANGKIGVSNYKTPLYELGNDTWDVYGSAGYQQAGHIIFRFPVPYSKRLQIKIYNAGTQPPQPSSFYAVCEYTESVTSPLRLKANVAAGSPNSAATFDFLHLPAGNAGWIAAIFMSMESWSNDSNGNTVLERDVSLYRDGEAVPSIRYGGTEDFLEGAYYWHYAPNFNSDNGVLNLFRPAGDGITATMRCHVMKDILSATRAGYHYSDGVIFRWETEGIVLSTVNVWTTVLYYTR